VVVAGDNSDNHNDNNKDNNKVFRDTLEEAETEHVASFWKFAITHRGYCSIDIWKDLFDAWCHKLRPTSKAKAKK
jgi:hypothetical protein